MFFFSFLFCWAYAGDSPDHERGDGAQDESSGFQPEEHASRSPADEQTIPSQHSQVTFHYCNQGVMGAGAAAVKSIVVSSQQGVSFQIQCVIIIFSPSTPKNNREVKKSTRQTQQSDMIL